jgi:glucose/arabinose dehydrogenase
MTSTSTAWSTTSPTDDRRNLAAWSTHRDGSIPGQPVARWATVVREIFARVGPEGVALHPTTGELCDRSRPQGGDEINIVRAGRDYGWPDVASYGSSMTRAVSTGRRM